MPKLERMNREQIDIFEKTFTQLCGFYDDITILVKKNPNDLLNSFKLCRINKVISSANEIVGDTKPFDDFDGFDIDGDMPSNSDASMVLGQYINCMELVKKNNTHMNWGRWYWDVDGNKESSEIQTSTPTMLKK